MNTSSFWRLSLLIILSLSASHSIWAQAQTPEQSAAAEALNALYGDFNAPDLSAPTLLGVNANQVSKPANVKAFAASLIGAAANFPETGKGLGIEIAPVQFIQRTAWGKKGSLRESLEEYAKPYNRISRGFTISGAQVGSDSTARAGLGIAAVLIDKTDPLLNTTYTLGLARAFKAQKEAQVLIDLIRAFNDKQGDEFNARIVANRIPRAQITTITGLLPGLAVLPGTPLVDPTAFAQDQMTRLKRFIAGLDAMQTTGTLTAGQYTAMRTFAETAVKDVIPVYGEYFEAQKALSESTNALVKAAKERFEKTLWNATVVQLGGGWTWCSPDRTFGTLEPQSNGIFLRAAFRPFIASSAQLSEIKSGTFDPDALKGLQRFLYLHTQVVANVQYNRYHNSMDSLRMNCQTTIDSLDHRWWYGARLLIGNSHFRLSGEYSVQKLRYNQMAREGAQTANKKLAGTVYSATIGAEVRLVDKLWLEFAIGSSKPDNRDARLLTLAGLKYAIRNNQRFKTN